VAVEQAIESAIVGGSAILLATAALAKGRAPVPTERALATLGWPSRPPLVRLLATLEIVVAIGALTGPLAVFAPALAALYLGFAGFALAALAAQTPLSSCGCFGRADTPPTTGHVVWNTVVAAVAVLAAEATAVPKGWPHCETGEGAWLTAASSVAIAVVGYLVLAVLPRRMAR
jgi:hypothetical protein